MKMKTKDLTKISICIALICVSSYIAFPLPFTPAMVTAQSIIINLIAIIMKPKHAFITMAVFLLLGALGMPVFSGGTGGFARFFGPTGGFLIGYLVSAVVMSFVKERLNICKFKGYVMLTIIVGMPVIYLFGTIGMCLVQKADIVSAVTMAVVPFLFGDVFKCIVGSYLGVVLNKAFKFNNSTALN